MFDRFNKPWDGSFGTVSLVILSCSLLSLWNTLELLILIALTFRKWKGLCFWSFVVATIAVVPYSLGLVLRYFRVGNFYVGDIMNNIGWIAMVTGQSVVLYSRLHLIDDRTSVLRAVRWMIIVDAVIFHVTTTIVHFISTSSVPIGAAPQVFEKIQMTGFSYQPFTCREYLTC